MNTTDFDAAVLDIVNELGAVGTYVQSSKSEYSPTTGMLVGGTTKIPAKMIIMDLTLQSNGLSLRYGTEVISGDKEAYMVPPVKAGGPAISITPGSDKVIFAGVTYSVVTFKEVNPSGTSPVVYFLYLRR